MTAQPVLHWFDFISAAETVRINQPESHQAQTREHHVTATPSWLVNNELLVGLQPRAFFVELSHTVSGADHRDDLDIDRTA